MNSIKNKPGEPAAKQMFCQPVSLKSLCFCGPLKRSRGAEGCCAALIAASNSMPHATFPKATKDYVPFICK